MTPDNHPLVGAWRSLDDTLSVVEYCVTLSLTGFHVAAIDSYDGEQGEVQNVTWDDDRQELQFSCYWGSTGRYSKCRFHLLAHDKVEFTYTYTDHEILVRKAATG